VTGSLAYDGRMHILRLDGPLDDRLHDPVLVVSFDGWTDAGRAGSMAAEAMLDQWQHRLVGTFDPDRLFDYRDRRPLLPIDGGLLGDPEWPAIEVLQLTPPQGQEVVLIHGAEPDLSWRALCADIVELAGMVGAKRYVGLGAVPGPIPHTRPTRVITTASRDDLLDRIGLPDERLVVPASCQVVVEAALRDAGLTTLGMWARVPHYVAGEYPDAARVLLDRFADYVGTHLDTSDLAAEAAENRQRLDHAAEGSPEIESHIADLESVFDAQSDVQNSMGGNLPTGDEIAAELQRFLRGFEDDQGPGSIG